MTLLIYKTRAMSLWVYGYADLSYSIWNEPSSWLWQVRNIFEKPGKFLFGQKWLHFDIFIIQNKAKRFAGAATATCFALNCQNSVTEIVQVL